MDLKKPIHLCLDLDATLITSYFDPEFINFVCNHPNFNNISNRVRVVKIVDSDDNGEKGKGELTTVMVVFRPHLQEFINFIDGSDIEVSIWSAGQYRYVRALEYLIFPPHSNLKKFPKIVLTRKDCHYDENFTFIHKPLVRHYDLTKTLALDDRDDTFSQNPENGIHIPVYDPGFSFDAIEKDDATLLNIIEWFKRSGVLTCQDVRTIRKPFVMR